LLVVGDQDVLRWFVLVVALLLDPAAVLLLLAASPDIHHPGAATCAGLYWCNEGE
jgi:hypothetical protein